MKQLRHFQSSFKSAWLSLIVLTGFLCLPQLCFAYVGPGSGITAIGAVLAVIGTVIVVLFGFLLWPIRFFIRWIKKKRTKNEDQ